MAETFDQFITKWTNKPVDFDGVYPNQCMDLMHQYVYEVLGLTDKNLLAAPSAYMVYTNFKIEWGQYFTKIDNTPTNIPNKGDILFYGTSVGSNGHVCMFNSGSVNSFTSFDANWPTGSLPHIQTHNYNGLLGWLTPKIVSTPNPSNPITGDNTPVTVGGNFGVMSIKDIRNMLESNKNTITDLQNRISKAKQDLG